MEDHSVLDLYAGHGVGVAIRELGAKEHAVEINKDAIATRRLNGMGLAYENVWDIEKADALQFDTLWGSPPCQAYSSAGSGKGRKELDRVYAAIDDRFYEHIDVLRTWSETLEDDRAGHVLVPLAYAHRFRPRFIALEQVPTVRPVWERYAEVLHSWGYSVKVDVLNAEQFGVPQTRKRAILVARNDGTEVQMPTPTHSRYYSRTPERLDPDVLPWVSMAEALGALYPDSRPSPTVTGGGRRDRRVGAVRFGRQESDPHRWRVVSNYGTGGDPTKRGRRMNTEPSATITSKFDRMKKEPT